MDKRGIELEQVLHIVMAAALGAILLYVILEAFGIV